MPTTIAKHGLRRSGASRPLHFWAWLLLPLLLATADAHAQRLTQRVLPEDEVSPSGKHCYGEGRKKLTLEHYVAGSINPLGIGNMLRLGWCSPLVRKPGLLFDYTNFDIGLMMTNSPTDINVGLQMFLAPISILVLRAEASVFYIWPIPLQGAGFITVNQPSDFQLSTLSPDPAGPTPASTAFGARAMLGAALQGQLPIGSRFDISVSLSGNGEYWQFSSSALANRPPGSGLYSARRDVILLGSADWVVTSTAALLIGVKVHPNATLRFGGTNDLVYVPSHGYLGNIAAGIIVLNVPDLRQLAKNFNFFLRVGTFTHHAFRSGVTLAGGVDIIYELLPTPSKLPAKGWAPTAVPESAPSSLPPPPAIGPGDAPASGTASPTAADSAGNTTGSVAPSTSGQPGAQPAGR